MLMLSNPSNSNASIIKRLMLCGKRWKPIVVINGGSKISISPIIFLSFTFLTSLPLHLLQIDNPVFYPESVFINSWIFFHIMIKSFHAIGMEGSVVILTKLLTLPVLLRWGRNCGTNARKTGYNVDYWYGVKWRAPRLKMQQSVSGNIPHRIKFSSSFVSD